MSGFLELMVFGAIFALRCVALAAITHVTPGQGASLIKKQHYANDSGSGKESQFDV